MVNVIYQWQGATMPNSLPSIGFIILSHQADGSLARLISALDREYSHPPIVIHHDLSQAPRDLTAFGPNIRFVPHVRTGWAKWGVVEGALRALRELFEDVGPDWFFLLSTSDYPIMPGDAVRAELAATECDAFIDARPLDKANTGSARRLGEYNAKLAHFDSDANRALKYRFYCGRQLWVPIIRFKPRLRLGKFTIRTNGSGFHPYGPGFGCFFGDHWLTANRRAADALLETGGSTKLLRNHLINRTQPDETFYATVLSNTPGLTLCLDNRRFAEWNGGGAHPMALTQAQLPEAFESKAFFARKLPDDGKVSGLIDDHLSGAAAKPRNHAARSDN